MIAYQPRYTTLASVRQALRIPDSPAAQDWRPGGQGDASLLMTIQAAEATVEAMCGRTFLPPSEVPYARYFSVTTPSYTTADSHIPPALVPVDDFVPADDDAARFWPRGGQWLALRSDDWQPVVDELTSSASYVDLYPNSYEPVCVGVLELTARYGVAVVPPQVREASKLLSARLAQREASPLGVTSVNDVGMYISRVDHDVRSLLAPWAGAKIGVA